MGRGAHREQEWSEDMIPVGYMAKRVKMKPEWLQAPHVVDIYSVSNCQCENFADYIPFWKHNGYWFFDSPEIIKSVAKRASPRKNQFRSREPRCFITKHMTSSSTANAGARFFQSRRFKRM
jgi:hypothetical protein